MKQLWKRLRGVDRVAIVTIAVFGVLLIAQYTIFGNWIHRNEPIYTAYKKSAASISELRDELAAYEPTKDLVVLELSDGIHEWSSFEIMLDKTTRDAKPEGYSIYLSYESADGLRIGEITGWLQPDGFQMDGCSSYRGRRVKLQTLPDGCEKLWLICGDYYYTVSASFVRTGLSEQEIEARDADLQALLYSVADRIIDAAG